MLFISYAYLCPKCKKPTGAIGIKDGYLAGLTEGKISLNPPTIQCNISYDDVCKNCGAPANKEFFLEKVKEQIDFALTIKSTEKRQ